MMKPEPAAVSFLLCLGGGFPGTPLLSKKSRKSLQKEILEETEEQ